MALMSLDLGEKRIGVALSESGIIATPHTVIQRASKKKDFAKIQQLVDHYQIEQIVVGLPYSLSAEDQIGPQAQWVMRYAEALAMAVTAPVVFFDERYSTVQAQNYLALAGQKKVPLDAAAAAVILQNYLEAQRNDNLTSDP